VTALPPSTINLSSILSALSYALDLTEGQPPGHSARSCLIGMAIARALRVPTADQHALFYALLMKDAGCSSNAARVFQLFGGDDHAAKRGARAWDWRTLRGQASFALKFVAPGGSPGDRMKKLFTLATSRRSAPKSIFQIRCERGAEIAEALGFSSATANAIRSMDEHWDGGGLPAGLKGQAIPLLSRIIGIAQVADVFSQEGGPQGAIAIVRQRSGRWFDPDLVNAFVEVAADSALWARLASDDIDREVTNAEPMSEETGRFFVDNERLDRIAMAFAWVVDAKSPFTYQHSERVANVAQRIGSHLGMAPSECVRLKRAALLHDIGKLAVPNRILDKPGRLTAREWDIVRLHPYYSYQILERVPIFGEFALDASAHHERMDGRGYYRNLKGDQISLCARILATADKFDALTADRPYRPGIPLERVCSMLAEDAGRDLCPDCVDAVKSVAGSFD
jgi:HD-GYP domain-containing protein (c-di-GMP phosphodiesterase class II)